MDLIRFYSGCTNCIKSEVVTPLRYGLREGFYCSYEGEDNQRPLEEFRVGRESSGLNRTSTTEPGYGEGAGSGGSERGGPRERGPREHTAKMTGLYGNEKLGKRKPVSWRLWGGGGSEKNQDARMDTVTGICQTEIAWRPVCALLC